MKVLDLQCTQGHGFEGWFASAEAFEAQRTAGLIECPLCADTAIIKLLSAPRLNLSGASALQAAPAPAVDAARQSHWMRSVREWMAKTEDVGERLPEEVRRMHYGEAEDRSIRGQATREQVEALREEGIAVIVLPLPVGSKETLQ